MADEQTPEEQLPTDDAEESGEDSGEESGEESGEDAPAVAPEHEPMLAKLREELGDDIVEAASTHGDLVVRVRNQAWHRAAEAAKARLDCEYLSFISAIDWLPRPPAPTDDPETPAAPPQPTEMTYGVAGSEGRLQVFACVESTDDHLEIIFKADLDEDDPRVASWTDLYPGADWHERECWEMFGVVFDDHPHLRKLYLPTDFEGYPLRKDFPLLAREVKPWPGLVDVELMPDEGDAETSDAETSDAETSDAETAGAGEGDA